MRTDPTVSRQREWQRRKAAAGLCVICGAPALKYGYCERHHIDHLDRKRARRKAREAA